MLTPNPLRNICSRSIARRATLTRAGLVAAAALLGVIAPASAQAAGGKGARSTESLPPAPLRLFVVAPSASVEWTYRIENTGDKPVRIPADVRLLRFEIDGSDKKHKSVKCAAAGSFRPKSFPEDRALYLPPGQSYSETFNPKLICFGKKEIAALTGGAVVHPRYGWDPGPKGARAPKRPYVAESLDDPPAFAPLREIVAPTVVLSHEQPEPTDESPRTDAGSKTTPPSKPNAPPSAAPSAPPPSAPTGAAGKPSSPPTAASPQTSAGAGAGAAKNPQPPPAGAKDAGAKPDTPTENQGALSLQDANAPRLEITLPPYSEIADPRTAILTVTATNVGHRAMTVAVRPRMLSFLVDGPLKTVECVATPTTHSIPRDNYRSLGPKQKISMPIILHEICPLDAFDRPGLYRVQVTLDAGESGEEAKVHAYTAYVPARIPTLIRLHEGPEPFYTGPPKPSPSRPEGSAH